MEFVAGKLAGLIGNPSPPQSAGLRVLEKEIVARGDILQMLKLPAEQTIYRPQKITIRQVLEGNMQWRATRDAPILLL